MQHNGILLQHRGKKVRRQQHPARRDNDGADVIQRQRSLRFVLGSAYDKPAFARQRRAVLKDVEDVVAHIYLDSLDCFYVHAM